MRATTQHQSMGVLVGLAIFLVAPPTVSSEKVNPIEKVIQLISDLQQKIIKEGEAEQKGYEEFAEWCEGSAKEKGFEIKTANAAAEEQTATIEKAESDIETASSVLEELAGKIGTDEADLKAANLIREKEQGDFEAEAKELTDTITTLSKAQSVLEKELGGGAFIQKKGDESNGNDAQDAQPVLNALSAILEASALSDEDRNKLTVLMQQEDGEDAAELDLQKQMGAPDPAAYESKSGGILDTLADMQEKAEGTLDEKQKNEMESKHNFEMLKQSLEDAIAANKKELAETKKDKAGAEETKATAEGELAVIQKDLAEDKQVLHEVHGDCMDKASAFETAVAERDAELKALATAKKTIQKTTGGASDRSYDFVQLKMTTKSKTGAHMHAKAAMKAETTRYQAVRILKQVARVSGSVTLAQLADRVASAVRNAGEAQNGADPFAKVKGMIQEMLEKLLKEAGEEAAKKAYCDKEMSETKKKKESGETSIEDLTTKLDKAVAKIAELKEEVTELSRELAALVKGQAEMDKLRMEENEEYKVAKAELEEGLNGVEMAIKVLKDYYAKADDAAALVQTSSADGASVTDMMQARAQRASSSAPASGAAGGIIGMLEVAASDFSKNLADMTAEEDAAQDEYEKLTQENKITKTTKEQDVKYKTKERKSLEKMVSETEEDRDGVQTELDATLEYYEKLKPECISKPEPYEERKKRREAEIEGLKEALSILEGEAVFLQTGASTHRLRGIYRSL